MCSQIENAVAVNLPEHLRFAWSLSFESHVKYTHTHSLTQHIFSHACTGNEGKSTKKCCCKRFLEQKYEKDVQTQKKSIEGEREKEIRIGKRSWNHVQRYEWFCHYLGRGSWFGFLRSIWPTFSWRIRLAMVLRWEMRFLRHLLVDVYACVRVTSIRPITCCCSESFVIESKAIFIFLANSSHAAGWFMAFIEHCCCSRCRCRQNDSEWGKRRGAFG